MNLGTGPTPGRVITDFLLRETSPLPETHNTCVRMHFLWPSTSLYSVTLEGLIKDKIQLFITYPANYF